MSREAFRDSLRSAEMLVPSYGPFGLVHFAVFSDSETRDAWWPPTRRALPEAVTAHISVRVNRELPGFRFAPDHTVTVRHRPVSEGVDRKRIDVPASTVGRVAEPTIADLEAFFSDLGYEGPDLYEDLYGDGRYDVLWGDFVDWPTDDDEPR